LIKLSKYEAALVVITIVVFFGGVSSAYFILKDLKEIHKDTETNNEMITENSMLINKVIRNLEGNVTTVNQTLSELTEDLQTKEDVHPFSNYETEIFYNLTKICYP